MSQALFVVSHLFSDSNKLVNCLKENPRIKLFNSDKPYNHPEVLFGMSSNDFVFQSDFIMDHLLYNYEFNSRAIHKMAKFIYIIRDPKQTLSAFLDNRHSNIEVAYNYFIFRIRRIYEMSKETNHVLYTWNDLENNNVHKSLEDFLEIKLNLNLSVDRIAPSPHLPSILLKKAEGIYEKYLYHMRSLNDKLCN